jgi:hypothetical protein
MQEHEYDAFAGMISGVADALGKKVPSAHGLVIWWNALRHLDLAAVGEALSRHVANPDTGNFMPTPADVNRMLGGTTQDSALVAWAAVDQAMRRFGPWYSVGFDDPLIHRVLQEMGGWMELSKADDDAWPFRAKEFQARYRGYKMRGEVPEHARWLPGMFEAGNSLEMRKSQPPLLLGDPSKAAAVMRGGSDRPLLQMHIAGEHLRHLPAPPAQMPRAIDFSDGSE